MAMDGDTSTFWDPRESPSSLTLDFSTLLGKAPVSVDAIGLVSWGDTTHDCKTHTLGYRNEVPPHNGSHPTAWQQLPSLPSSAIRIEPRDAFHNIIPMGLPANATEVASLLLASPPSNASGLLVFPEPREYETGLQNLGAENGPGF